MTMMQCAILGWRHYWVFDSTNSENRSSMCFPRTVAVVANCYSWKTSIERVEEEQWKSLYCYKMNRCFKVCNIRFLLMEGETFFDLYVNEPQWALRLMLIIERFSIQMKAKFVQISRLFHCTFPKPLEAFQMKRQESCSRVFDLPRCPKGSNCTQSGAIVGVKNEILMQHLVWSQIDMKYTFLSFPETNYIFSYQLAWNGSVISPPYPIVFL